MVGVPAPIEIFSHEKIVGSSNGHEQGTAVKHETSNDFDEHLDNVVLRERRRMLVSRKSTKPSGLYIKDDYVRMSDSSKDALQGDHGASSSGNDETCEAVENSSLTLAANLSDPVPIESELHPTFPQSNSFSKPDRTMTNTDAMPESVSTFLARVKDEPIDISELYSERMNGMQRFSNEVLCVKNEPGLSESLEDELDHLPLVDRINLLSSGTSSLNASCSVEFHDEKMASDFVVNNNVVESAKPIHIIHCQKRRRTATNSVETALEEDAPELLKVLIERGVSLEEIKLYGEEENEDALDESLIEDSFSELEAVISQLFLQRQNLLKSPLLRFGKGEKASYSLSCLLSLVEQTRYLQTRKWPVEWGWCRDLQSFIFVFQRHNRIVLERPEYGFATYFFELLNSMPVHWQVKRLVTAMKLTNCGRVTLIEDKPLVVGEDLSEVEARVLAEYGWTPNTGIGTMLNYCDRVVHDRKQEIDSLEWRSKIAKLLMNGYNSGNIISKDLPKKLIEYQSSQHEPVKLEE